jgi:hypothetical protein
MDRRPIKTKSLNSELLMYRKFTLIFTTNFVGSLDIRAFREVFPIEVRSPEIKNQRPPAGGMRMAPGSDPGHLCWWPLIYLNS